MIKKFLLALFSVFVFGTAWAQEEVAECSEANPDACDPETVLEWFSWATMAGVDQVERRLSFDALPGDPLFPGEHFKNYKAWKARLKKDHGLSFGTDYITAYMKANDSPGEDTAFSGSLRFYGVWEATGDGHGNSGALIWKVEHRHAFGSHIPPSDLGPVLAPAYERWQSGVSGWLAGHRRLCRCLYAGKPMDKLFQLCIFNRRCSHANTQ